MSNSDNPGFAIRDEDPLDIFRLWEIVWSGRYLIVTFTIVTTLFSLVYAFVQPNVFRSEALLAPAEVRQSNNPMLAQLGVAAGLVGVNINDSVGSQVVTAIATLQSREFLRQFIQRHDLLPQLFAETWDSANATSKFDSEIYSIETQEWIGVPPTLYDGYRVFRGALAVSQDQSTGMVSISIDWSNPERAKQWIDWLVLDINSKVKNQDLVEATSAIEYLQNQLQSTQLVEMRQAFYQLIESQTRIVMLTDVRDDYVFRTVDPAFIPQERLSPNRRTIVTMGIISGLIVSVLILLIKNSYMAREFSSA